MFPEERRTLLLAERSANGEIILTPCGTSIDLHAGQMIDRVGVALGLPFPCGPQLEKLAQEAVRPYPLKVWFEEGCMSLSGPATAALRAIEKGEKGSEIALGTLHAIAKGLYHTISHLCAVHKLTEVLFVGGVSANLYIRKELRTHLSGKGIALLTADPICSTDGAIGNAWLGVLKERGNAHDLR